MAAANRESPGGTVTSSVQLKNVTNVRVLFTRLGRWPSLLKRPARRSGPAHRYGQSALGRETSDRRRRIAVNVARAPSAAHIGSIWSGIASASRVPCRNSIGIWTSSRCVPRSRDGCFGRMQRKAEEGEAAHAGQRATRPAPAMSSVRRTTCRRRSAAVSAIASRPPPPRRAPPHARALAGRAACCRAPCRGTGSARWQCRARRGRRRQPP